MKSNIREIQREHLREVASNMKQKEKPCLHDQCEYCHGTGIKKDGTLCIHFISCNCPKCSYR